MNLGLDIFN